jgi:dATP pyrophosphohydrolase
MRAQFQILVLPFLIKENTPYYAVFKRRKGNYWQFIAGGGEDDESIINAAKRESEEEAGIDINPDKFIMLDTVNSVPRTYFKDHENNKDIYVIPEYAFAVQISNDELTISGEHTEYRWMEYSEAYEHLKYDGNRTALWELNEKIKDRVIKV